MRVNILGNLLQRKRKFIKLLYFHGKLVVMNSYLIPKELLKKLSCDVITKRVVLKVMLSIFDPLGILSPTVINFKLLFHELCFMKIDSDLSLAICYLLECVKVPMPAHQVLPLTAYIFEASYSTSATQANKI